MQKYRIAEGLAVRCAKQKRLKELAFFYTLKYSYSSGCIHNYNPTSFRKKLIEKGGKYSRSKIDRHIALFLKWGWCEIKEKHLYFKKNYSIQRLSRDVKIICEEKELLSMIRVILIARKQRQCMFSFKAREADKRSKVRNSASMDGSKYQKLRSRLVRIKKRSGALSRCFKAGSTKVGEVLGYGRSWANKTIRKAEDLGLLTVRKNNPRVLKKCSQKESFKIRARSKYQATLFWKEGRLFRHQPNEYNVPFFVYRSMGRAGFNNYQFAANFVPKYIHKNVN